MTSSDIKHDPFAVLRIKEFNFYLIYRLFFTLGYQMQTVIVYSQIYKITKDEYSLGMIGLTEAIPFIIVSFFSGHIADHYNRKRIILFFTFLLILSTLVLYYYSLDTTTILQRFGTYPIFYVIICVGVIRGFLSAALPSIMSQIVPRANYSNSATWNSTAWHVASVIGPAGVGFLIVNSLSLAYVIDAAMLMIAFLAFIFIASKPIPKKVKAESLMESLAVGINFVWKNKIVLGALSLDLFAVLFGGAVAMLPAFVDKVLGGGDVELGYLRAAPALGAVIMALIVAYKPIKQNAGRNLFLAVGAFGVSTILFGLSSNFYLALFFLILIGAFDNISVVIRHTILQLTTPDEMRGRVSAVNGIFIGSSNEIGAYESGVTARAFGLKSSIVFGGIMTILVVIGISRMIPKLRKLDLNEL